MKNLISLGLRSRFQRTTSGGHVRLSQSTSLPIALEQQRAQ
jgi:hypothetical protein